MTKAGGGAGGTFLKVAFVLPELGASGGVGVVRGHVRRLAAFGIEARAVVSGGDAGADDSVQSLGAALGESWDIVVATWWTTAHALFACDARRRLVFLQSLEERFYDEDQLLERLGAASMLGLPVHFLTVAGWLRRVVGELRPDARCELVRPGIDKTVFTPAVARGGDDGAPLRILVEGQPELPFKAIPEAIAAARAMSEPARVTLVAPQPHAVGDLGADRVTGALDPKGMAALYAEHDVVLKLSRVEGLGLVPLEAMHVGLPAVVAPYTGHEEYLRHGENGLLVGFDDQRGTVAALDRLARDRDALRRLSAGALQTAASWPSAERSTAVLADALRTLAAAPAPDPPAAAAYLLDRQRLAIELGRLQVGELHYQRRRADQLDAQLADTQEGLREAQSEVERAWSALDELRRERTYRAATQVRDALHRFRR